MIKIELENISYVYAKGSPFEMVALKDINLKIESNSITGIIGHTGSGKSTLMQMLNGLEKPDTGRILLDGVDIWDKPKEISKIRFKVGLVMQYPEYQLFEETVKKDIAFGPTNMGLSNEEIASRVCEAAQIVGLSPDLLDKSPFDLSGGEKRRVAIAGIMAMKPEVIVLDEPAAGLDPIGRETIFNAVCRYREQYNATVIIVSHSMEDMARICDKIAVLANGSLMMIGSTKEVFERSAELSEIGLGIPEITQLAISLRKKGADLMNIPYTVDDAVYSIMDMINK